MFDEKKYTFQVSGANVFSRRESHFAALVIFLTVKISLECFKFFTQLSLNMYAKMREILLQMNVNFISTPQFMLRKFQHNIYNLQHHH